MKRELRSFVQFDGQYLVSLDIRASQPYLSTLLMRKGFYSAGARNSLGWRSLVGGIKTKEEQTASTPAFTLAHLSASTLLPVMFPRYHQLSESQLSDQGRFLKVSWETDFYTILAEEFRVEGIELGPRNAVKRFVMWLFFEHKPYKYGEVRFVAFEKLYPVEAGVIRGIGVIQPKLLPVLLQRIESRLMLHHVAKTVSEKLPESVLLTVHDCLLTTQDSVSEIELMMRAELTAITGLPPGIKREATSSEIALDALATFAQTIFDGSQAAVEKSITRKTGVSYAGFKLIPSLLNANASYGNQSTRFNPLYTGRIELPDFDDVDRDHSDYERGYPDEY